MPNNVENITVRIVGKLQELGPIPIDPSRLGSILSNEKYNGTGLFIPVNIFGDDEKNVFIMELERTLWKSLHEEILNNSLIPDRELICLNRKIITIWKMPGTYEVKMRYDIESAELRGGEYLEGVIKREIDENKLAYKCLIRNLERIEKRIENKNVPNVSNVPNVPGVKNNKLSLKIMDLRREWLRRTDEQGKSQRPPVGWPSNKIT